MKGIVFLCQVFAAGCLMIGGVTYHVGHTLQQKARQADADWERLTLEEFSQRDHQNQHLFRIRDFRVGQAATATDRCGRLSNAYVPLHAPKQLEGNAESVLAVIGVSPLDDMTELEKKLSVDQLDVQCWNEAMPRYAFNKLQKQYPALDPRKVRWGRLDSDMPTVHAARRYTIPGGLILGVSFASLLAAGYTWRRDKRLQALSPYSVYTNETSGEASSEVGESSFGRDLHSAGWVLGAFSSFLLVVNFALGTLGKFGLLDSDLALQVLCMTLPAFFVSGIASLALYVLTPPMLKVERRSEVELPDRVIRKLEPEIQAFVDLGFDFVGYSESYYMGKKWNAYLQDPQQTCLVTLAHHGHEVIVCLQGILNDGIIFDVGRFSIPTEYDGFDMQVPIAVCYQEKISAASSVELFSLVAQQFEQLGRTLLRIPRTHIFHHSHYATIVSGWWAYKKSLRLTRPEVMPGFTEIGRGGEFCFRRVVTLDNAFPLKLAGVE